jgi:hypothetical protein
VLGWLEALVDRARDLGGSMLASSYDSVVLAWDEGALQEAVSLATSVTYAAPAEGPVWACGIARGDVSVGKPRSPGAPPLAWGEPLAAASALARLARPREVLADISLPAVVDHELLTNRARVGQVGRKRVRGFRVDSRCAWRSVAAADVARMVDPPLVGRDAELAQIMSLGGVVILRADSGFGGSRMLAEVALATRPSRSITLTPLSVVQEPLGALRRAMAFVAATERITLPPKLHPVLDQLLGAQGVTVENAALLIAHQVQSRPGEPLPSLLLDDATDIDEPSLEACARAVDVLGVDAVRVVARIDSMSQLPRVLARLSAGDEVTLGRLDSDAARELATGCTGGALEPRAREMWARRGGSTPLGVVEAVAAGIAKGELLWSGDTLGRLRRQTRSDVARPVGFWISRHAEALRDGSRDVLTALAHLGGEAIGSELIEVVKGVAPEVDLAAEIVVLRHNRWIREPRPGVFVLASRAHREAILEFSRDDRTRDWRTAVAKALERAPGTLRRAEAAQHAARAGMGEWAARLAMTAARTAAQMGLEEAASTLAAFAGVQHPGGVDLDLGELAIDDEDATTGYALPVTDDLIMEVEDASQQQPAEPEATSKPASYRAEPEATSKPVSYRAEPEATSKPVSYRAELEAARALRETQWAEVARRSLVDGAKPESQRRGLLALARAYANEGRSAEALVHGLEALARMKEAKDARGTRTCLLFLARLYEQTERPTEAVTLKSAAQAAVS